MTLSWTSIWFREGFSWGGGGGWRVQGQLSDFPVVETEVSISHVALDMTVPYCDVYLKKASSFPYFILSLS